MHRKLLGVCVAAALAAEAFAMPRGTPRHIKLEAGPHEGAIRFLGGVVSLDGGADGKQPTSWVTVTRAGVFRDPRYGEFEITREMLLAMVKNFNARVYGQDVFYDVAHEPDKGAAGKIVELAVDGSKLRARVEWTPYGVDAIKTRGFIYSSAEYHENWRDNEKGQAFGPVLCGAGLTIRPVIKHLEPVSLSEAYTGKTPTLIAPDLQHKLLSEITTMWKDLIEALRKKLAGMNLGGDAVVTQLVTLAEQTLGKVTDKSVAEVLIASFEQGAKTLAEQIAAAGGAKDVKVTLALPDTFKAGMSAEDVKKLMEDVEKGRAESAKKLAEALSARQTLLVGEINKAEGIPAELRKELAESVKDLVTAEMSEDQVKRLAANQVAQGNRLIAQQKLIDAGYTIPGATGSVHITVDSSNNIKALQEHVDKRVIARIPDAVRFERTGGKLLAANKDFAERVLARFDAERAAQLHAEHKMLAAGDGKVSDVSVPAIYERTVIREALYSMIGLQFVDTGTLPFNASALIPYSYRDTTAAGKSNTRVYEGGSIPRAGVKQTSDTAYPIPQKLAFEVSDELRYLTGTGQLDWDAVVENVRNASRIIGEDGEQLIFNEVLNAADQYASVDVANEAVANGDAAKTIFKLDNFPVVRPKKIYDLQGNQVGNTLYGITVKVNAVAKDEWDGTGNQAAGLYWYMDYNLGEIHFVDEAGAPSAPGNALAIVCSYTYATNVYAFDTDLGADAVDDHWNKFLYRYGLRKAAIEQDRFYSCNFGLMSMTAMTSVEQAKQFAANYARAGTDLTADGTLGRVKGVPNFHTTAPGLNMGDQRVVLGQRGVTRFRMMKPWAMGQLQDQKDANGRFTGKKEAYGDQFVVLHTPTPLKAAYTSMVLYSSAARVDR